MGDSYAKIDGKDVYTVNLGTIGARQMAQRDASSGIQVGLAQRRTAQNQGIIFQVKVVSDEHTEGFPPMRCTETGCEVPQ